MYNAHKSFLITCVLWAKTYIPSLLPKLFLDTSHIYYQKMMRKMFLMILNRYSQTHRFCKRLIILLNKFMFIIRSNPFTANPFTTNYFNAHKLKFAIKDLFSKYDQIRNFLWIWSHLLNKSLMENFIFCAVFFKLANEYKFTSTINFYGQIDGCTMGRQICYF